MCFLFQYLLELDWHVKGYIALLGPNKDPTLSHAERVYSESFSIDPEESKIKVATYRTCPID